MIYDNEKHRTALEWHCPFGKVWLQRARRAAKICRYMTADEIDAADRRLKSAHYLRLPPGKFLEEPQAPNGLPLSWYNKDKCERIPCDVYDYDSLPEIVITNGLDDWPLRNWKR